MRYPCTMDPGWIVAVIFWPDRVTEEMNWDEGNPNELIDRLKREGRMIELSEGQSNYHILFCFDEPIPHEIEPFIQERSSLPDIVIKGRTLFGPVALLVTETRDDLSKFEELDLPEGTFRAEFVRAKIPRRYRAQYVNQRAGRWPYLAFTLTWVLYWIVVVLFFPAMTSWSWWGWQGGLVTCAAALLAAIAGCLLHRTDAYRQAKVAREQFDQEHPATMLLMSSIDASSSA